MTEAVAGAAVARPVTPTTILALELTQLCSALDDVVELPASLRARIEHARDMIAGLDPYLDRCTTAESPALAALASRTRGEDWSSSVLEQEMLSGHVEGRTLNFLVSLSGARRVLEIGMFTGYSALAMAEALPDDGTVVACELDPSVAQIARECFDASPAGRRITIEVGAAMDTLRRLSDQSATFDFVFIDADKAGYLAYLNFLLESDMLAPHSVIAVDNTLLQGEPYLTGREPSTNGAAIAAFNAAVADDPRVEQVLLPVRDGLTLIRRAADRTSP